MFAGLLTLLLVPGQGKADGAAIFPAELRARVLAATARVTNLKDGGVGSGVLVARGGPHGYVLTARHVVSGSPRVDVALRAKKAAPRPETTTYRAEVLAEAPDVDLAVLRFVADDNLPDAVRLCPPNALPEGKSFPALAAGWGSDTAPTCGVETTTGARLLRKPREERKILSWEMTRATPKGHSGGALVGRRGHVIGIASGNGDGKGYFTHAEEIHGFLRRHGLRWLYEDDGAKSPSEKP